jgi:hypothetical protein
MEEVLWLSRASRSARAHTAIRRWAAAAAVSLVVAANAAVAIACVPVIAYVVDRIPEQLAAHTVFIQAPIVAGLAYNGTPVDNVYPYSREGTLLHDVLLYDGAGAPLAVRPNSADPERRVPVTTTGKRLYNAFPIRYFEPGTARVANPNAAPPIAVPEVRTPALAPSRSTTPPASRRRHELEALGARLELTSHGTGDADRVPLRELDDLVLDLDPPGTGEDDIHLFLLAVPVAERLPEVRRQLLVAEAEVREGQVLLRKAHFHAVDAEALRGVRDVLDVLDRVIAHGPILTKRPWDPLSCGAGRPPPKAGAEAMGPHHS